MLSTHTFLYFLLGLLLIFVTSTEVHEKLHSTDLEELTPVQRASLQNLKTRLLPLLPHDYMKEDRYLVQFLISQRYDAQRAETMVKTMLKWREDNKVDNWIKDPSPFADITDDFPMYTDGNDRTGRPIFEVFFGDWDLRSAAVSGKMKHLINFAWSRLLIMNEIQMREQQAQGKNVTEWILLANLEGFTIATGGCPACLPAYVSVTQGVEQYFPNTIHRLILVNTPSSFIPIINLVHPVMSLKARKALKVFDSNKEQWMAYINKLIDPSEISERFGGHKKRSQNKSLLE